MVATLQEEKHFSIRKKYTRNFGIFLRQIKRSKLLQYNGHLQISHLTNYAEQTRSRSGHHSVFQRNQKRNAKSNQICNQLGSQNSTGLHLVMAQKQKHGTTNAKQKSSNRNGTYYCTTRPNHHQHKITKHKNKQLGHNYTYNECNKKFSAFERATSPQHTVL